MGKGKVVSVLN